MGSRIIALLMLIVMLATACTPQVAPAAISGPVQQPADAPVEPAQKLTATTPPARTLTVMAAASLTESFTELGKIFESQNPGVTVAFNFAGSQQLAQQLDQGAEADVFASANTKYMDAAVTSGRVAQNDAKIFVTNRLVVIFPRDNPGGVKGLKDLAKPGLKLNLADKSVPVGQYALDFLDKAVKDTGTFGPGYNDAVLANVVSYETGVKAVVTKVALGEADAGIVYATDYNAEADRLGKLDIPDALNSIAAYPIAAICDSKNPDLARSFVDFVLSPEGQSVMAEYGFIPIID